MSRTKLSGSRWRRIFSPAGTALRASAAASASLDKEFVSPSNALEISVSTLALLWVRGRSLLISTSLETTTPPSPRAIALGVAAVTEYAVEFWH